MKILGIGESVIDKVIVIQGDQPKEFIADLNLQSTHVGGPVPAALILLSRLGQDCTFLTSLGRDDEALLIKSKLAAENLKVIEKLQQKSKVNTVLVDSKTGQRQKIRGATTHHPIRNIPIDLIKSFDYIIIDRHEQDAFYEVCRNKRADAKIIIDPSTEVSDFTMDMIRYSEYPILPIESLVKIGNGKSLGKSLSLLFDHCRRTLIVTAGELGCLIYDGDNLNMIPAIKLQAVDTTGAGDIYRGAFAYGLVRQVSLVECAKFANTVSALQCTKLGNVDAIPTKQEIEEFGNLPNQIRKVNLSQVDNYFCELNKTL